MTYKDIQESASDIFESLCTAQRSDSTILHPYVKQNEEPFIYVHTYMDIYARYPYHYTSNSHTFYLLIYTIDGEGSINTGQNCVSLSSRTVYFHNNQPFSLKIISGSWHFKLIFISGNEASYFYQLFQKTNHQLIHTSKSSGFIQLLDILESKEAFSQPAEPHSLHNKTSECFIQYRV